MIRSVGWAFAALAVLAAIAIGATRPLGYDLVAYTGAAQRLLAGAALYQPTEIDRIVLAPGEFLYPPPVAVLFVPLALLPFDVARALWTAALVALAALLGWWIVRPLDSSVRPWAAAGYALFLPLVAEVTLGNLNLVTLCLALAAWHWRSHARSAGALLAAAFGLKLLPLTVALFVAGARRWRVLAWAAAVLGTVLIASLVWQTDAWVAFARLLVGIASAPPTQAITLIPDAAALRWALPLLAAAVAVVTGAAARDARRADAAFAVALASAPLAAPGIWYPYLVFALPLLGVLLRDASWPRAAALAGWAALEVPRRPDGSEVAFYGLLFLIAVGAARAFGVGRPAVGSRAGAAA